MWKMHEIREIIKLFEESSLQELEVDLEEVGANISLKKQEGIALPGYEKIDVPNPAAFPIAFRGVSTLTKNETQKPAVQSASVKTKPVQEERQKPNNSDDPHLFKIVSPMVGTFYRTPAVDGDPFIKIGDKVGKSSIVCILEAMKLFNEIEAEVNGEIIDVLVDNGQLVEYGQPLFLVKTE